MKKIARRIFLGTAGAAALATGGGIIWVLKRRVSAPSDALLIDPDGENFVYQDGWIVGE